MAYWTLLVSLEKGNGCRRGERSRNIARCFSSIHDLIFTILKLLKLAPGAPATVPTDRMIPLHWFEAGFM
jgi:hypothetical protein